jgi:hypothetical protein
MARGMQTNTKCEIEFSPFGSNFRIANYNHVSCLILRGVSDIMGSQGGEAYDNLNLFSKSAGAIMERLVRTFPARIECVELFKD